MNINNSCALIFWEHSLFSSFYCDYFNQKPNKSYSIRCGAAYSSDSIGAFYVSLDILPDNTGTRWHIGASISFKL